MFYFQNSFTHIQAISDALEESFATIDFGPELSSDDDSALKSPRHHHVTADNSNKSEVVVVEEVTTNSLPVPELSDQLLPEPNFDSENFVKNDNDDDLTNKNSQNDVEIPPLFERVTSVDDSVTPIIENNLTENSSNFDDLDLEIVPLPPTSDNKSLTLTDWSMRTIPDPPSGFQDSIIADISMIPDDNLDTNNLVMNKVPTIAGPMKFSINSYNERTVNRDSLYPQKPVKLSRTESAREDQINHSQINSKSSPTMPSLTKSESFGFARFNGNSTLAGK